MAGSDHQSRPAYTHVPSYDGWLRFDDTTNAIYEAERGALRAKQLSVTILIGLGFYNLYNFTSVILMPDILWLSVLVRLAVITPTSLLLAHLVLRVGPMMREFLVLNGMIGALLAPIYFFWQTRAPLGNYAFSELDLTLVFGCLVLLLRFRDAVGFLAFGFVAMVTAILLRPGLPPDLATAFLLQSATACVFCLVSNYVIERRRCAEFVATLEARYRAIRAEDESEHLQALSQTDPLTGLPNRRALDAQLNAAFAAPEAVAIFMLDLDYFKQFNDTLGHPAGDVCLEDTGRALAEFAEENDLFVARFGGEEFTVLIRDRNGTEVKALAQALVRRIAQLNIAHPARPDGVGHVTVSVGAGIRFDGSDKTIAQVMNEADEAIYVAKRRGRNQVAFDDDLKTTALSA